MHAIVSLLDERHYTRMEDLWRDLEVECGLAGVTITPLPHFSWQISTEYDFKLLESTLAGLVEDMQPFTVHTSGLGLFTGETPVIFIPVVKDAPLSNFHKKLWEHTESVAIGLSPHYSPEAWVPHISLAHGDVDRNKVGCAIERLAFRPFDWEIQIDHLALVYQLGGQVGRIMSKFPFGGAAA